MRNTLAISGIGFTFGFPLPILFAIMLNEIPGIRFKKFVQTTSYLPHFISWVVIAGIMYQMLDKNTGIVNRFIKLFGGEPIYFFAEPSMFWGLSVAISIWKGLGWSSIIYLASIVSIDPGLYEAAAIDGAGRGKRMWHITLPGILPTVTMMLILQAGSIFSGAGITPGFDGVYNLSNATLSQYSDILDIWVFRMGIQRQRYDIATAMGLLFGVVNMALVLVANWIARHVGEGYSII
jgi:putative aldouronate transport system permease protein